MVSESDNSGGDDPDPKKSAKSKTTRTKKGEGNKTPRQDTDSKPGSKRSRKEPKKKRRSKGKSSSSSEDSHASSPAVVSTPIRHSGKTSSRSIFITAEDEEFLHREAELARSICKKKGASVIKDSVELVNQLEETYDSVSKSFSKPNVLVTGITGSGKSSLINSMFGREVATTGTGVPITQHFTKYDSEDSKTVIYDSKGLEHGQYEDFISTTTTFFDEHQTGNSEDIHVVWYVVNTAHARFEPFEQELCIKLFSRTPIFFLLNKSDISTEQDRLNLRKIIEDMKLPNFCGIIDVIACSSPKLKSCDVCPKCKSDDVEERRKCAKMICGNCGHSESLLMDNGLAEVVRQSLGVLPEIVKDNFVAAQNVSLALKEEVTRTVLTEFWDACGMAQSFQSLIQTITRMLARLSLVWEFRGHGGQIGELLASDLVTCLRWKRRTNILGQEKRVSPSETQRRHLTSLGILWNLCLKELALQLLSTWAQRSKNRNLDMNSTCSTLFLDAFSAMNEDNLKCIEIQLLTTPVGELLSTRRLRYSSHQIFVD